MNFFKSNNKNLIASVNSTLNAPPKSFTWVIYVILLFMIVLVIYFTRERLYNTSQMVFMKVVNYFKGKKDIIQVKDKSDEIVGNWCFVGEDLTGRFCVKVPSVELCPKNRAFKTRNDCEMVTASPMPLTLQENSGTTSIPLAGLPSF